MMHDPAVLLAVACIVRGAIGFGNDAAGLLWWLYTRSRDRWPL